MDTTNAGVSDAPTFIRASDLVRLAQGFYCVFWGLLLMALTGTQLLITSWWRGMSDLFLAAGIAVIVAGSWRLRQARLEGIESPAVTIWRTRTRALLVMAVLLAYFCVLFEIWRRVPANLYLLVNAAAFVAMGIIYMIGFSRAVGALAAAVGQRELAIESRLYGLGDAGLLLVPFVGLAVYVTGRALLHHASPLDELHTVLGRVNIVLVLVLLLPFSLTLSLAWTAKDAVLRQLAGHEDKPRG